MKRKRRRMPAINTAPGTLQVDPEALPSRLRLVAYNAEDMLEQDVVTVEQAAALRGKWPNLWINVDGLGDAKLLADLGRAFGLHSLTLEDVVHVRQRPKVEEFAQYQFIVLRSVTLNEDGSQVLQTSMVLGDNFVITFNEQVNVLFAPVRERLRKNNPRLRQGGCNYLAYSLIDALIDTYFPILEACGERTESLQEEALLEPQPTTVRKIHQLRRDLLDLRRAIWPLRDEMNTLLRSQRFLGAETHTYLRDVLDHTLVLIDLLESLREISGSLMDLYLSSMGNRMNEVMKWLTIVSTIFIPLTFIAGVYGMNFDPTTSPYNMPELHAYWGYPGVMASMLVTALCVTGFAWHKGWFRPMVQLDPP